jgi:CubicO group peptidase (beta-lactamase class C family)
MMTNQLTEAQRANSGWWGQKPFAIGRGFGLGVAVVLEPSETDMARRGHEGAVSWPGAYGGWWLADPKENTIFIFLAHNMVDPPQLAKGIGLGVWAAIDDAQRVALA